MNRTMLRLADELRTLADQLDAGELPDKGVAAELGREVEAALSERRPKRRPGERARQARDLARLLSRRTGVQVTLSYSPYKDYDSPGWRVEWTDGPTHLHDQVAALADRVPALDVTKLQYRRGATYRAEVAAMLHHADEHPEDATFYGAPHVNPYSPTGQRYTRFQDLGNRAHGNIDYPERIDEQTERRIRAISSLNPHHPDRTRGEPHPVAWLRLGDHVVQHGWSATRDWLDQIADDLDNPDVTNLAQARGRRSPGGDA